MDEYRDKLRFFFDDNLLLAALDLVDRDNGEYPSEVAGGRSETHLNTGNLLQ